MITKHRQNFNPWSPSHINLHVHARFFSAFRILATEQWHQEKDEVAKELKRIKKTRMIDELNSLSILEDQRAGKQFYGADAYKSWLSSKDLHADTEGD